MKKVILILLIIVPIISVGQIVIPDANFKNALVNTLCVDLNLDYSPDADADSNDNGEIELSEAQAITYLITENQNIASIAGIENFTELRYFNCGGNNLTELDASPLTHLISLGCQNNSLSSLNVANLVELNYLYFSGNHITSINLQTNSGLISLWCADNLLEELNLCGTNVRFMTCENNPNLTTLYLKNNVVSPEYARYIPPPLPSLFLSNLPMLEYICYDEGELPAIYYGTPSADLEGVTMTTDCDNSCELGRPEFNSQGDFTLYPNPATEFIRINSESDVQKIEIYTMLGQLIKSVTGESEIKISDLNNGTYIISIDSNNAKAVRKFIKQ